MRHRKARASSMGIRGGKPRGPFDGRSGHEHELPRPITKPPPRPAARRRGVRPSLRLRDRAARRAPRARPPSAARPGAREQPLLGREAPLERRAPPTDAARERDASRVGRGRATRRAPYTRAPARPARRVVLEHVPERGRRHARARARVTLSGARRRGLPARREQVAAVDAAAELGPAMRRTRARRVRRGRARARRSLARPPRRRQGLEHALSRARAATLAAHMLGSARARGE